MALLFILSVSSERFYTMDTDARTSSLPTGTTKVSTNSPSSSSVTTTTTTTEPAITIKPRRDFGNKQGNH